MKAASLRVRNFRSFKDSGRIELTQMNVLIGANNSGKSSILRGLQHLQQGLGDIFADVRVGSSEAQIDIDIFDMNKATGWTPASTSDMCTFTIKLRSSNRRDGNSEIVVVTPSQVYPQENQLKNVEPNHFIIPYLSKRKTASYSEDVREQSVLAVEPNMTYLSAKLSRLANPAFPAYSQYSDACRSILGFVVTAIPSYSGQRAGIYLPDGATVPIDQMGDGVPNIVHLLASLAISKDKLFLIEEPENDLHPKALKALLDLIITSSSSNQFVISTHSNIVVSHLCGIPESQLLRITSEPNVLPTEASVETVPSTPEARISVLQELGYSFSDFDMWDGWLILEESSAERIIRDYLIPWFVPRLARVRTVAAGGIDNVEPLFKDFQRLVLFTHLQPAYKNKTWVRVDGDGHGQAIISKLRKNYQTWPENRFQTNDSDQFERYYPGVFAEKVEKVLSIQDGEKKRSAKLRLLKEVMSWLDEDTSRGRKTIEQSAASIIADLHTINSQLLL